MGQYLQWQEECADKMKEMSVLETTYLSKMRQLTDQYQPKIQELRKQIQEIYIANGIIKAEKGEVNGSTVQEV